MITSISAAPELEANVRPTGADWLPVSLPDTWKQRWPEHDTVWYALQWQDDCQGLETVALSVSHMTMAGSVYINDTLLWRDASLEEPFSRSWNMPRYWVLPMLALDGVENTLWFRVTGMPYDILGLGEVNIGDPTVIWDIHQRHTWQKRHMFTLNLTISLVLGCLFLTLWFVRRQEAAFAWYATASLLWAGIAATMLATSPWPFPDSSHWNRWVSLLFAFYCTAFCLFTWCFGEQRFPRLTRLLGAMAMLLAVGIWWVPAQWLTPVLMVIFPVYAVIFLANCVQFQFHAWHHRQRHNTLLAACLLFFILIGLHDLLAVATLINSSNLYFPVTSPVAMIFMFLIIADRFSRNLLRIERFNADLRAAVDTTRRELTQTLQRKHQLESSNIRLTERLTLAHDLHDSLGSSLMRSIALVEQTGKAMETPQVLSMLKELRGDLRQIIDNSSPAFSTDTATPTEWIAPLRHRFVRLFDELGLQSNWSFPADWPRKLSSAQVIALTRFIEEALTNAIKHSRADTLEVVMRATDNGGLMLMVRDNGIGFDLTTVSTGIGVGMHSMRARIERIGGRLEIHSESGETRFMVYVNGTADNGTPRLTHQLPQTP